MKNLLKEFGIKPKIIDYGEDAVNRNYREIETKNKLLDEKASNNKKNRNQ